MLKAGSFALLLLLAPTARPARQQSFVDEIIAKARKKMADSMQVKRKSLMFNQTEVTETLSPDGSVLSTKKELFLLYGVEDQMAKLLLELNDQPVLGDATWATKDLLDEKFFDRFNFSERKQTTDKWNNRPCYVFLFKPKNNPPHNDTHESRTYNLLTGTIYIDKETYALWYVEGHLSKPYSKALGMAGCWQLDVTFETQNFNGIQVGNKYSIVTRYNDFLAEQKYERHFITDSDFRYR